ncbi:MAG: diacylglycerol kinase (ATP) [Candidatus Pelagisphaera sp.]|jgi:diacylglycerol kinase (ATP)
MRGEMVFIINPLSGKSGKGPIRKERIDAFIQSKGLNARAILTERAGHATELAMRCVKEGAARVICVGGDGTMNEVARVLVGIEILFGLVPMGSGNGLARHLGLPLRFEDALENATSGSVLSIDTGVANGHPFFNVMGIGLDAEIGMRFNRSRRRGLAAYIVLGLKTFAYYRPSQYIVEADGNRLELEVDLIVVANSSQYGNDAFIAPDASLEDGKLNMVAVEPFGLVAGLSLLRRVFAKTLYRSAKVHALCSEAFTVRLSKRECFHVDGEILECEGKIDIRARPRSLRMIVPS